MLETRWWQRPKFAYAIVLTAALIGALYPATSTVIIASLAIFSIWSIYQLQCLDRWLKKSGKAEPPESHGLWGVIFDKIYYLQKRERRARRELQTIITRARQSANSLNDGVITIKRDGTLEWWNRAANHLIGLKYPEDVGQQLTHLWRTPALKAYFSKKNYQEPLVINSPKYNSMQLQIHVSIFGKDDRLMLVRDITRLQHLEQMRTEFVANVSHELRTPLTVIRGYLENFSLQSDSLKPSLRRGLAQLCEQSHRMEALVNDLLLLSKLETSDHKDDQTPIQLKPLLTAICQEARLISQEKGHEVSLDMPEHLNLRIQGSASELRSAISNLTVNAVKYTPNNGHIAIKVAYDEPLEQLSISVQDDGGGIDPEHVPRLTERFYRADASRAKKTGGTGLGLAIVKHVMMRHDGELNIQSELGKGSQFNCLFPKNRIKIESLTVQ